MAEFIAALGRFRVLDLTQVRAGPTCVKQLADFGADVIRIEPALASGRKDVATGSRQGADMLNLHRNKRSMSLNLKAAAGREILYTLVKSADVVVENFRPDVKFRLKIDYESLAAINPKIVLASISGFGQDGPYRERPGFDQIAQGMTGLMSVTGKPGDGPMRTGAAIADVTAGLYCALGILTALLEREVSGKGQWVQSSLLHAGIALMDFQAARYLVHGEVPGQVGNDHPTSMPTSAYPTRDGFINIGATGELIWLSLCKVLKRVDLIADPRFATDQARPKNRTALNAILAGEFGKRDSNEWIELLNVAGVPCGPIYTVDQVFADPQVQHMKVAEPVTDATLGPTQLIAQAAKLSRTPGTIRSTLPARGANNDEVLREAGFSTQQIAQFKSDGVI